MRALAWALVIVLAAVLHWAFDHFLWDWFSQSLEAKWHIKEAQLIASVSSYVIPILIVIFCLAAIYWLLHQDISARKTGQTQPDMRISDALDYIVNDSRENLKQPPKPYVEEFGPAKGRLVTHFGIEHEDARTKVSGKLNSGELSVWGRRQISCHIANQFELSLRPIPADYWDSYQLDPLSCLHHTEQQPQTVNLPGKPDILHWTGLMLSKQQVGQLWPRQSYWRRLFKRIKRKTIIKARPDLYKST